MDRKLQRHRADSLRQHGFLVTFNYSAMVTVLLAIIVQCVAYAMQFKLFNIWNYGQKKIGYMKILSLALVKYCVTDFLMSFKTVLFLFLSFEVGINRYTCGIYSY